MSAVFVYKVEALICHDEALGNPKCPPSEDIRLSIKLDELGVIFI